MKNKKIIIISSILLVAIAITTVLALVLLKKEKITYMTPPTINGVALGEYTIVYDEQGLDYNKRAAEYIKNTSKQRYGVDLSIVDDNSSPKAHEIVVGETSRSISAMLNEETTGVEFSILAKDGSIALEGDYFVIAAAAFYFMEHGIVFLYGLIGCTIAGAPIGMLVSYVSEMKAYKADQEFLKNRSVQALNNHNDNI